uniref:Methyltransferase-like protein 4 n=1 Tax=Anopheles farauti TaxID=69004 RepID=A0A182Q5F2_9DIPT
MESYEEISENTYLLNHSIGVENLYRDSFTNYKVKNARLNSILFEIHVPYDSKDENYGNQTSNKRKRLKTLKPFDETTQKILENHSLVNTQLRRNLNKNAANNKKALEFVDNFNACSNYDSERCFRGQNSSVHSVITEMDGESFIIPPSVTFINSSVDRFSEYIAQHNKFDLIVLDPPWWNKYIRRIKAVNAKSGYKMLTNADIKAIPLERHLHENTLVLVWCTNALSHIEAVSKDFFPKWGVELVGCWYWIKITSSGEPVCKFNEPQQKQPYERLFIGLPAESTMSTTFPRERFLYSVPSAIHSHKPPLYGT